jgi:amino acid permease
MSVHGATVLEYDAELFGAQAAGNGSRAIDAGRTQTDRAGAGILIDLRLRGLAATLNRIVENLPPFWVVFLFIVAVSLLPAMLVLPLAIAAIGLLPGLVLLIAVGGISLLTMAHMAEAVARCRPLRYGFAFLGLLVEDYLGPGGSRLVAQVCIVRTFLLLLVPILGLALTLTSLIGFRPEWWAGLLLLLILRRLYQQENHFSVTALTALGAINLGLLLILSLIAISHRHPAHLSLIAAASLGPAALSPTKFGMGLGVFFCCYTGHLSVLQGARVILPRDPDGRALISGTIAATAFVTVFMCLWAVAVNSALPAPWLTSEKGTALVPLAARFGPSVSALGSVLACLMLGRSALGSCETLFYLIRERLSAPTTRPGGRYSRHGQLPAWVSQRVRFGLCALPTVLAFAVVEVLLRIGVRSLTEVTSVVGLLTVAVSGGILPPLLLLASRRKGAVVPGLVLQSLERPLVAGGIYLLFMGLLLVHGLFLWKAPAARAAALGTAAAIAGATVLLVRRGTFAPRLVLELREELGGDGVPAEGVLGWFDVSASGQPVSAAVRLEYAHGEQRLHAAAGAIASLARLRGAEFRLPVERVRELKVWAHRVTPEGSSEGLAGVVEVECGGATRQFPLGPSGGKLLLPVAGESCRVWITLAASPA